MKTRNTRGFHVSSSATTARSFDLALVAPQTTMVMTLISSLNMTSHSEATTCGSSFVLDDYPIVSSDKLIKYFKLRQRSLTELSLYCSKLQEEESQEANIHLFLQT